MADPPVDVRPRAHPVRDDRRERHVAVRQLGPVVGGKIDRHEHRRTVGMAHRLHPFQHGIAAHRASRRQAQRQRIGDRARPQRCDEVGVGRAGLLAQRQRQRGKRHLGDLAHCAEDRLPGIRAVADTVRHDAAQGPLAIGKQRHDPDRYADPVDRIDRKGDDLAGGKRIEIGARRVGQVGREHARRQAGGHSGYLVTCGGTASAASSTASALAVSMPGAYSKGVSTASKSSGATASR